MLWWIQSYFGMTKAKRNYYRALGGINGEVRQLTKLF